MSTSNLRSFHRRAFLRGAGGVAIGLPFLESFAARKAMAAAPKRFAVVFQCNGVDMDRFWPNATALTPAALMGSALEPIAQHAAKLLIPRGIAMAPRGYDAAQSPGCDHQKGMGCKLTSTPLSSQGGYPTGPSIDFAIAKSINPGGKEPFNLGVGAGNPNGPLSRAFYTASGQPAILRNSPWKAYQDFVGMGTKPATGPMMVDWVAKRRKSVLDMVKGDIDSLKADARIGAADKKKLDLHYTSVRSLEVGMMNGGGESGAMIACNLPTDRATEIQANDDGPYEKVGPLMMEVMALALACDYNRVVTVQFATGSGGPIYRWLGDNLNQQYNHHKLSHGATTDAATSANLPEAEYKQSLFNIDKWHIKMMGILLDKLASYTEPGGSVLDNTAVVYTNELSLGLAHDFKDLPIVIAGGAGGALKQGQLIKMSNNLKSDKDCPLPRLWTTLANAVGYKDDKGAQMATFGKAQTTSTGDYANLKA